MAMRIGGARRKTRYKFSKHRTMRGKISLRKYLQVLETGQKVALRCEPSIPNGMYFRRFHGKIGTVGKRLGTCYEVHIHDQDKAKRLIVHPVHLQRLP